MAKTYRDMHKINELSEQLIKELKLFADWMVADIEYYGRDAHYGELAHEAERWGETDLGAISLTDHQEDSIREDIDHYVNEYHPELDIVQGALKLLERMTSQLETDSAE